MNMPKDTKGTAPEDVEAHRLRSPSDVSGAEQRDSGEDVEAHRRHFFDTEQAGADDDVEAHGAQRPRPEDSDRNDDTEVPRWRA